MPEMESRSMHKVPMQEVAEYFYQEFGILESLHYSRNKRSEPVPIPAFFGLFLAAAFSPDKRPVCFVVPSAEETALIASCLIAFYDIGNRFDQFAKDYERSAFMKGSRVKVLPNEHVYEYDGLWGDHDFRLKEIQDGKSKGLEASRSFPIQEIVRLEPTESKRPKGKLARPMGNAVLSQLDSLLSIKTFGNCSLFQNSVVLACTKERFQKFLTSTTFSRKGIKKWDVLSELLPWGVLTESGEFKLEDKYQSTGQPAIALGLISFYLSECCRKSLDFSKIVVVSRLEKFIQNIANYDSVIDRQKVILFAEERHAPEFAGLIEKGIQVWPLDTNELFMGLTEENIEQYQKEFSTLRRAADRQKTTVEIVSVDSGRFKTCANTLEQLRTVLKQDDQLLQSGERLLQQLYFLLLDVSSLLSPPGSTSLDAFEAKLVQCTNDLTKLGMWLHSDVGELFQRSISLLQEELHAIQILGGSEKAKKLASTLKELPDKNVIVIPRTRQGKTDIEEFLANNSIKTKVGELSKGSYEKNYSSAILTGWPNGQRWLRFIDSGISNRILLLCYSFEERWFKRFVGFSKYSAQQLRLTADDKMSLLALPSELRRFFEIDSNALEEQQQQADSKFSFAIEQDFRHVRKDANLTEGKDQRNAYYTSFSGDAYAYLTPSHSIPVLTEVLESGSQDKLRWSKVRDLEAGDVILFRDSSEGNVLREVAENTIGVEAYTDLRANANSWRPPLQKLGADPRVIAKFLTNHGLKRDWQTINNWLYDPDHIGPSNIDDIISIGRITGEKTLVDNAPDIMADIQEVRRQHVLAGHALSEMILELIPEMVDDITSVETELKLAIGTVWIVTVEYVEKQTNLYPAQYLNVLRWS